MPFCFERAIAGATILICLIIAAYFVLGKNSSIISTTQEQPSPSPYKRQACGSSPNIRIEHGSEEVFNNRKFSEVIKRSNQIIYKDSDETSIFLIGYDTVSREKVILYEEERLSDSNIIKSIRNMYMIDETVYFSVGYGFSGKGMLYIIRAGETEQELIFESQYSSIRLQQFEGTYYVAAGFGDGCGGKSEYALLDIENQSVSPILFNTGSGCVTGNTIVGLLNDTIILADHQERPKGIADYRHTYISITSIQLTEPYSEQILLSESEMPSSIFDVIHIEGQNKLLLIGLTIYEYDIVTDFFKELSQIPVTIDTSNESSFFCYTGEKPDSNLYIYCQNTTPSINTFELNTANGVITKINTKNCNDCTYTGYMFPEPNPEEISLQEIEDELDLPEEFEVYCYE